jgi:hypothetical protein
MTMTDDELIAAAKADPQGLEAYDVFWYEGRTLWFVPKKGGVYGEDYRVHWDLYPDYGWDEAKWNEHGVRSITGPAA